MWLQTVSIQETGCQGPEKLQAGRSRSDKAEKPGVRGRVEDSERESHKALSGAGGKGRLPPGRD